MVINVFDHTSLYLIVFHLRLIDKDKNCIDKQIHNYYIVLDGAHDFFSKTSLSYISLIA